MSLEGVSEVVEVERDQVRVQTSNTEVKERGTARFCYLLGSSRTSRKAVCVFVLFCFFSPVVSPYLQDRVVRRDGVLPSLLRGLFWPFGIVVRS